MTAPDAPRPPAAADAWSSTGGTAVSSGQTSAYALKALQAGQGGAPRSPAAATSGAHARLAATPDVDAGSAGSGAQAQPPAALSDRWALAHADDFTCSVDVRPQARPPARRGDGSVVGSITGFFKRCTSWLNEPEKKSETSARTRSGLKVITDPTPAEGSLISLQHGERKPTTTIHRDRAKERAVREQAQRLAAVAGPPTTPDYDLTRRILLKQRQMADVERQRAQDAKVEAEQVTILRRRTDA